MSNPAVKARVEAAGNEVAIMDAAKFAAFMEQQRQELTKLKAAGVTVE